MNTETSPTPTFQEPDMVPAAFAIELESTIVAQSSRIAELEAFKVNATQSYEDAARRTAALEGAYSQTVEALNHRNALLGTATARIAELEGALRACEQALWKESSGVGEGASYHAIERARALLNKGGR